MSSPKHSSKGSASQNRQPLIPRLGTKAWEAEIRAKHIELGNITPAPQPAKSAQTRDDLLHDLSFTELALEQTKAELERVKHQRDELLAAAKYALDYASDVCPSSALPYESKLKAAITNAEKEAK